MTRASRAFLLGERKGVQLVLEAFGLDGQTYRLEFNPRLQLHSCWGAERSL